MPLSDYTELQQSVNDYLEQDDVTGQVTDFIRLLEVRVNRELSVRWMHKTKTGFLDVQKLALPTDFIEAITWRIVGPDPDITGQYVPPDRFFGMQGVSTGGTPRAFTIVGTDAYWAPDPTGVALSTYPYILEYLAQVPPLTDTNSTNWLLDVAPDIYLYGALLEAQPFLLDDERLAIWAKMYEQSVKSLVSADARGRYRPGGVMRAEKQTPDGKRWVWA